MAWTVTFRPFRRQGRLWARRKLAAELWPVHLLLFDFACQKYCPSSFKALFVSRLRAEMSCVGFCECRFPGATASCPTVPHRPPSEHGKVGGEYILYRPCSSLVGSSCRRSVDTRRLCFSTVVRTILQTAERERPIEGGSFPHHFAAPA